MKKIISVMLVCVLALTCVFTLRLSFSAAEDDASVGAGGASQYAQATIQGGAVLHCYFWSYNQIRQHLPEIYAAGYTAVQTCPIQTPKDYSPSYQNEGRSQVWWKFYQPVSLSVADGTTWLGTKNDLRNLCTEADNYGIKVIVDIVSNHVANKGPEGGGYSNVYSGVESSLQNAAYYHTGTSKISSESRYDLTQNHMGMPDLNTGNSYIQTRVLNLLKECVDLGVDGFRFDAAKHIETPNDAASFRSNYWPTVINGIKSYKSDVYCYGEVLGGAGTNFSASNYTTYMSITEDVSSRDALNAAKSGNASALKNFTLNKGESASQALMWVESHDTYEEGVTSGVSNDIVKRTWAITGSRNDITTLYLARPSNRVGLDGDTTWKSTEVAEINKFKNYFNGQSEYLASSGSVAYNERGTSGVSISKLNGGGAVSLPANRMAAGTYKDQISGNYFTVSNGVISGTVGSSGIAVVYNPSNVQPTTAPSTAPSTAPTTIPSGIVTIKTGDVDTNGVINVKDVTLLQRYLADLEDLNQVQLKSADCDWDDCATIDDVTELQRYLAEFPGNYLVGVEYEDEIVPVQTTAPTTKPATQPTTVPSNNTFTFTNSRRWSGTISCYYWSDTNNSMTTWPGKAMTLSSTNSYGENVYTVDVPSNAQYIIFSNGSSQTVNITIGTARRYYATASTDSSGHYLVQTW